VFDGARTGSLKEHLRSSTWRLVQLIGETRICSPAYRRAICRIDKVSEGADEALVVAEAEIWGRDEQQFMVMQRDIII
jgi:hypothetical protein